MSKHFNLCPTHGMYWIHVKNDKICPGRNKKEEKLVCPSFVLDTNWICQIEASYIDELAKGRISKNMGSLWTSIQCKQGQIRKKGPLPNML